MARSIRQILERRLKRVDHSGEFLIGVVVSAHGLRGEVKVKPLSDIFDRQIKAVKEVNLYRGLGRKRLEIEGFRRSGNTYIVKFRGIESRDDAESLAGWEVWIEREKSPPLEEGEYLFEELKGCSVFSDGEKLGTVKDILEMPSSHVLVIWTGEKEVLVPFIDEFVKTVDVKGKRIVLTPIEGMF